MTENLRSTCAVAVLALLAAAAAPAAENAAAMITRIEPADSGIARVLRGGAAEEAAFMMPLYSGDEVVVESVNVTVQVKYFGGADTIVRFGSPLTIESGAKEQGLVSGLFGALSDKVFRNNQLSRRNLVTRSSSEGPALSIFGFGTESAAQNVRAGQRELIIRWNRNLEGVRYRIDDLSSGRTLASGTSDGDFGFIDNVELAAGENYRVVVEAGLGRAAEGSIAAVSATPDLSPADPALGTVGAALRLLQLAEMDEGRWKFEAIQGVLELSADDIDRATLIEEISAL